MANVVPLILNINADFSQQFTWSDSAGNPINLTGWTAKMEIANVAEPPVAGRQPAQTIYYTLSSTGMSPQIVITALTGTINILIPGATTATFTWTEAVYDLVLTAPGGQIIRFLQGPILVSPGVTTLP